MIDSSPVLDIGVVADSELVGFENAAHFVGVVDTLMEIPVLAEDVQCEIAAFAGPNLLPAGALVLLHADTSGSEAHGQSESSFAGLICLGAEKGVEDLLRSRICRPVDVAAPAECYLSAVCGESEVEGVLLAALGDLNGTCGDSLAVQKGLLENCIAGFSGSLCDEFVLTGAKFGVETDELGGECHTFSGEREVEDPLVHVPGGSVADESGQFFSFSVVLTRIVRIVGCACNRCECERCSEK